MATALSDVHTVSLNDKFNRSQWKYTSPELEEEISKDIHMGFQNKVINVLHQFLKWNVRDINYVKTAKREDPIRVMFQEMRLRRLDTCPILCCDPDQHFNERKCFPIYKVYQILKEIDPIASNHFLNPVFKKQVLENIVSEEKLCSEAPTDPGIEKIYPIYSLPSKSINKINYKKKIVLTVDFAENEHFHKDDETMFYTGINNLLDNINQNFTCMMSPAMKMNLNGSWVNFVSTQINNAELILVVFSPLMIDKLLEWKSFDEKLLNSTEDTENDGLRFLWNTIKGCQKPIAGVVFEENLSKIVGSLIPVVFYLPKNLKLLLGYLLHRLE